MISVSHQNPICVRTLNNTQMILTQYVMYKDVLTVPLRLPGNVNNIL